MKVTVAIVTRGRPAAAIGVVMALWRLRSGQHPIEFALGFDDDDPSYAEVIALLRGDGVWPRCVIKPRGRTRGHVVNRLVNECRDADVLTLLTDWTFPITPGWDHIMTEGARQFPNRIAWWSCPHIPGCVVPSLSKPWLEALDYRPSPEIFPFWHDDTWLEEVDLMAADSTTVLKLPASFAGTHGKTTQGREFGFWGRVYSATRPQRIAQAEEIALRLGLLAHEIDPDYLARCESLDAAQQVRADEYERIFGDPSPPSSSYHQAKSAALRLLDQPAMAGAAA